MPFAIYLDTYVPVPTLYEGSVGVLYSDVPQPHPLLGFEATMNKRGIELAPTEVGQVYQGEGLLMVPLDASYTPKYRAHRGPLQNSAVVPEGFKLGQRAMLRLCRGVESLTGRRDDHELADPIAVRLIDVIIAVNCVSLVTRAKDGPDEQLAEMLAATKERAKNDPQKVYFYGATDLAVAGYEVTFTRRAYAIPVPEPVPEPQSVQATAPTEIDGTPPAGKKVRKRRVKKSEEAS